MLNDLDFFFEKKTTTKLARKDARSDSVKMGASAEAIFILLIF